MVATITIWLTAGFAHASPGASVEYQTMAPIGQYLSASADEEIVLARSAAPPSISKDAEVLVLGPHGYTTAVKGKNGYVCLVDRGWFPFRARHGQALIAASGNEPSVMLQ